MLVLGARRAALGIFGASLLAGGLTVAAGAQGGRGQPPPPAPIPAILQNYQPVTAARLKNPEDGNWLMIRRTYDGWGYSPLDQITPANVDPAPSGLGRLDRRGQSP